MKRLLLMGTALLSIAPYASAMNHNPENEIIFHPASRENKITSHPNTASTENITNNIFSSPSTTTNDNSSLNSQKKIENFIKKEVDEPEILTTDIPNYFNQNIKPLIPEICEQDWLIILKTIDDWINESKKLCLTPKEADEAYKELKCLEQQSNELTKQCLKLQKEYSEIQKKFLNKAPSAIKDMRAFFNERELMTFKMRKYSNTRDSLIQKSQEIAKKLKENKTNSKKIERLYKFRQLFKMNIFSYTSPASIDRNDISLPSVDENSPQGKKLLTKQNSDSILLLRSDTADEIVTLQWKNLTEALANIDILKNEFETQFKAFQQIYKGQELDPKPLNEAIKDLLLKLEEQEKLKSQAELDEIWDKFKQQFLQKLALFIEPNLTYEPINKDTAVENFRFLFEHKPLHLTFYYLDLYNTLQRYASSIFLEEKVSAKPQTISGYDVFPFKEFIQHFYKYSIDTIPEFDSTGTGIITPYLQIGLSHNIDAFTAFLLIRDVLFQNTPNPLLFKGDIMQNFIQLLKKHDLLYILVSSLTEELKTAFRDLFKAPPSEVGEKTSYGNKVIYEVEKEPFIETLLNKISSYKEAIDKKKDFNTSIKCVEFISSEKCLENLQKFYKIIMDTIIKYAPPKVQAQAIIIDVLHNPDCPSEFPDYIQNSIITPLKTYQKKQTLQNVLNMIIEEIINKKETVISTQKDKQIEIAFFQQEFNKLQQELDYSKQELDQIHKEEEGLDKLKEFFTSSSLALEEPES